MKTLHEVEPSKALSNANTPGNGSYTYIITVPGAYHLTENLTTTGKSGILITAAGVTLDLHGFEIRADSFSTSGINIGLDGDRCTIKNGSIADFQYGVNRDLDAPDEATGGSFENLAVTGQSGIGLLGGNGWTVSNCRVHGGSNSGIVVGEGAVISNCAVSNLGGSFGSNGIEARAGSTVVNCSVRNCIVLYGIRVGRGSTLENCPASKNSGDSGIGFSSGIRADDRCLIRGCTATENTHPNNNNFEAGVGITLVSPH